jgi:hypothetical protein
MQREVALSLNFCVKHAGKYKKHIIISHQSSSTVLVMLAAAEELRNRVIAYMVETCILGPENIN